MRCIGCRACFETRPGRAGSLLRACESFALFCSMKGLQQVLVVVLRGLDGWSEGEPVGVGR
jgi:hypothetical protein